MPLQPDHQLHLLLLHPPQLEELGQTNKLQHSIFLNLGLTATIYTTDRTVLISQSLTLQHCMMLVSININKVRTKDFAIFASNRLSAFLKHSNVVERK